MTDIEELKHVLEILNRFDLPVSPILEYAIKEKIEQLSSCPAPIAKEDEIPYHINKTVDDYALEFANLSVGKAKGKKLPHKAILLIAIMKLIKEGIITENRIELDKIIVESFSSCWTKYNSDKKIPSVWIPFWYLKSESFWHFKPAANEEILHGLLQFAGHPSVGQMRPVIRYAYFDKALFDLLENDGCREKLKEVLVRTYIS